MTYLYKKTMKRDVMKTIGLLLIFGAGLTAANIEKANDPYSRFALIAVLLVTTIGGIVLTFPKENKNTEP